MAVTEAIKLALDFRNPKQFPDTLWNHLRISVSFSITKASEMYWRLSHPCLEVSPPKRTEVQRKQCSSTDPPYAVPFWRGLQSPRMSIQDLSWTRKTTKRERDTIFFKISFCFHVLRYCKSLILSSVLTKEVWPVSRAICAPTTQNATWCH